MTDQNPIADLLAAPLAPEWTVDRLAEEVLAAIAEETPDEVQEFVLDGETMTDRQSRRLLRPLLASLAAKSAAETGNPTNHYGGRISFNRTGPNGPVWIFGRFENTPGAARVALSRSTSPPRNSGPTAGQVAILPEATSRPDPPSNEMGVSGPDREGATTDEIKR